MGKIVVLPENQALYDRTIGRLVHDHPGEITVRQENPWYIIVIKEGLALDINLSWLPVVGDKDFLQQARDLRIAHHAKGLKLTSEKLLENQIVEKIVLSEIKERGLEIPGKEGARESAQRVMQIVAGAGKEGLRE